MGELFYSRLVSFPGNRRNVVFPTTGKKNQPGLPGLLVGWLVYTLLAEGSVVAVRAHSYIELLLAV